MTYGWSEYFQVNLVNGYSIGLKVDKWDNGNLSYIGFIINTKRFGWYESYNKDGSIDPNYTGFYLNNKKL